MSRKILGLLIILLVIGGAVWYSKSSNSSLKQAASKLTDEMNLHDGVLENLNPLTIDSLRNGSYPGSELKIEETLSPGSNYSRYITSYQSEGNKIYALLTIPNGEVPKEGFPVIVFNHGYIPPAEYRTIERYIAYTDAFSRNGYVLLRPDYRGHGSSEGQAAGGYGSNAYTIDVLNAVSSVKKLNESSFWQAKRVQNPDAGQASMTQLVVNTEKIGMWGHSMGGFITLRSMVVNKDIKAGVIWGGVVANYPDLLNNWRRGTFTPPPGTRTSWRTTLAEKYGTPEKNPEFWNSISANSYLKDISGPLQLHHGEADASVPVEFSKTLSEQLKKDGKIGELYTYAGDDHDITANFGVAMQRSVEFFDRYLK